jgi:prophage tail gpP-like protein
MTRVPVRDRFLGIDTDLLVSAVVYSLTPGDGSVTEVEVTLPDAYDIQPIPTKPSPAPNSAYGVWRENGRPLPPEEQRRLNALGGVPSP